MVLEREGNTDQPGRQPSSWEIEADFHWNAGYFGIANALREADRLRREAGLPEYHPPKEYDFSGKTVLITGAGSGIGAEASRQFTQYGATIIALDLDGTALDSVTDGISNETPGAQITRVVADVGRLETWFDLINNAPKIDILCNVAAIIDPPLNPNDRESQPNIDDMLTLVRTAEGREKIERDLDRVYQTDLKGPVLLSYVVLEKMVRDIQRSTPDDIAAKTQRNGVIINIGSNNVYTFNDRRLAYGTFKSALHFYTALLARSVASYGIRVNCIAPGAVAETLVVRDLEAAQRRMLLGINYPRDIVNAMLFLASDNARQITGQVIPIEGGRL